MAPPLDSLRLLGAFELVQGGERITLGQPRLEELIALLAASPGISFTRLQIAYHFWPDSNDKQARTNARNLLYKLKNAWPGCAAAIAVDDMGVLWRQAAASAVDAHRLEQLHAQAAQSQTLDDRARLLAAAAACYQGDFLPSCYADWALTARERFRATYASVLEQLVDALLDLRRYAEALRWATVLRDHDPLHESAYRRLMQVYMLLGDRAAAVRMYHLCASMLRKELGVEPSAATERLHAQLLQRDPGADRPRAEPHAIQRPRLVGRHAEWQQLQQAWRRAQEGKAQCILLWGEAGIGKTRLAEELVDWVQRQGDAWASSRSYAAQGALSYAPITEWLRAPPVQPALAAVDDLWRVELARLLPELLAERPDLPAPGPLRETWQQQRFFQSIVQALLAVQGPLLLHLDDMQWSDQETLTLLHFILHGARARPLLMVGAIRTEDAVGNSALAALMEALRHAGQLTELHLAALTPPEAAELAEQTAGSPITPDAAAALYAVSEGHPLFLVEIVEAGLTEAVALPASRLTATTAGLIGAPSQIPPKIYSLITARLGQLSPTAQQVASIAAVIGRAFSYRALRAAAPLDELSLVDALDELWMRRIVREQGGDGYDFSHDRIREVAYHETSRARRRLLHHQVAAALEAIHGDALDDVAGEMAAHYAQAGDSDLAYGYFRRAAKVAASRHALAHAEAMFSAALAHAPDDPAVCIQLLLEWNRILLRSQNLARWRDNHHHLRRLVESLSVPEARLNLKIELDRSRLAFTIGDGTEAVDAAQHAVAIAWSLEDRSALAHSYLELAHGYWTQARMPEAGRYCEQATRYAQEAGERAVEASSLEIHAATGMFSGMPAAWMLDLLTRAFGLAEADGDLLRMARLLNKIPYLRIAQGMGDFSQAEDELKRSLALAVEVGDRWNQQIVLSNLGALFTHLGDYRQALEAIRASLDIFQKDLQGQETTRRLSVSRHYLGAALMQMGRLDQARVELVSATEQLGRLRNRHFEVKARCDLGLLHHLAGGHLRAQEELSPVLGLTESYGDLRFKALVSTRLGYALEATGQLDEAVAMHEQGRALHDQMGQHYYALNALAGLARVADLEGDSATAYAHVQTIWQTIAGQCMDATVETARTLRTCYTILRQHDDPAAAAVLDAACTQLRRRAGTIDDRETVALFWQLGDHRFFQDAAADKLS